MPMDGSMGEVRIWSTARTQAEIQANMNKTLAGNETNLAGYWDFSEGSGTTTSDDSPNSNAGTLTGAGMTWGTGPTLGGGSHSLTGTNEDTTSGSTQVSAALTGLGYTDVDGGAQGMAVTVASGNGTWQFSAWTNFGSVSEGGALLLSSTSYIRYIPDGLNGETPTLTVRGWDQTSGTASTNGSPQTANAGSNGGSTAFSSTTGTASLTVSSVNDAPTATNDAGTATEAGGFDPGSNATGNVITNDADVDTGASLSVASVRTGGSEGSGTGGTVGGTTTGTYGTLTLNNDGSYTYVVDNANGTVNGLASGQTLTDTFNYTVSDGQGGTDIAILTITINGSDDLPNGFLIMGDGSGGGGGGDYQAQNYSNSGTGGAGGGDGDTLSGTDFNDVIFGDGSGGGGAGKPGNVPSNGAFSPSPGGSGGGGADTINGGAGNDIIFGDGFNGGTTGTDWNGADGGFGGGGGGGGAHSGGNGGKGGLLAGGGGAPGGTVGTSLYGGNSGGQANRPSLSHPDFTLKNGDGWGGDSAPPYNAGTGFFNEQSQGGTYYNSYGAGAGAGFGGLNDQNQSFGNKGYADGKGTTVTVDGTDIVLNHNVSGTTTNGYIYSVYANSSSNPTYASLTLKYGASGGQPQGLPGRAGSTDKVAYSDTDGSLHTYVSGQLGNIFTSTPGTTSGYGAGADTIDGGGGSDQLFGMGGNDTFVFEIKDAGAADTDTVWDFNKNAETDQLKLTINSNAINTTIRDSLIAAQTSSGGDRSIVFADGAGHQVTITVKNIGRNLAAGDFITGSGSGDPIALDLDGDGIELLGSDAGRTFDMDADGIQDSTGWVGPGDGLLTLDRNGNGTIDDAGELFSEFSVPGMENGLEALRQLDANGDGWIDAQDPAASLLRVWMDIDSDGVSQEEELLSLESLGIEAIDLEMTHAFDQDVHGNAIIGKGAFQTADGESWDWYDVGLVIEPEPLEDEEDESGASDKDADGPARSPKPIVEAALDSADVPANSDSEILSGAAYRDMILGRTAEEDESRYAGIEGIVPIAPIAATEDHFSHSEDYATDGGPADDLISLLSADGADSMNDCIDVHII